MKEFSIMPPNKYYSTERFYGSERHEVFEGYSSKNRQYSIEDGLVIFLTPEQHRTGKYSVHKNPKYWKENIKIEEIAERTWLQHYEKTKEDFIKRYGRNYI